MHDTTQTTADLPPSYEMVRGQLAGLLAGALVGAGLGLTIGLGTSETSPGEALLVGVLGLLFGGLVGVPAGLACGVVLRLLRGAPGYLACPAAGMAAGVTVTVTFALLDWEHASLDTGTLARVLVFGSVAFLAAVWIRRSGSSATGGAG